MCWITQAKNTFSFLPKQNYSFQIDAILKHFNLFENNSNNHFLSEWIHLDGLLKKSEKLSAICNLPWIVHWLHWFYHHLFSTRRTHINFASGAGKTVTANPRYIEIWKLKSTSFAHIKLFFFARTHLFKKLFVSS